MVGSFYLFRGNMNSKELTHVLVDILCDREDKVSLANYIVENICGNKFDIIEVNKKTYKKAIKFAKKINAGTPPQYLFGKSYFYKREFVVNKKVLIPRFDTEILVEQAIKYTSSDMTVCDMCCGSGICGITIALETNATCHLVDISKGALSVAKANCKKHNVNCKIMRSDMFSRVPYTYDIIVCNPPYIKSSDCKKLDTLVKNEPMLALDGGESGLDYYKILAEQSVSHLKENGVILIEIGIHQAQDVKNIFSKYYKNIKVIKDYNDIERVVIATNGEIL